MVGALAHARGHCSTYIFCVAKMERYINVIKLACYVECGHSTLLWTQCGKDYLESLSGIVMFQ